MQTMFRSCAAAVLMATCGAALPAKAAPVWFEFDATVSSGTHYGFRFGENFEESLDGQAFNGLFSVTDLAVDDVDPDPARAEFYLTADNSEDFPALRDHRIVRPVLSSDLSQSLDDSVRVSLTRVSLTVVDREQGESEAVDEIRYSMIGVRRYSGGIVPDEFSFSLVYRDTDGSALSEASFPSSYAAALALLRDPAAAGFSDLTGSYDRSTYSFRNSQFWNASFVVDRVSEIPTDTTSTARLVSATDTGFGGNGTSWDPTLSADGEWLAFSSDATNLAGADDNGAVRDIFLLNRTTNELRNITAGANGVSEDPVLSKDGQWLAFVTRATNLPTNVPDTNGPIADIVLLEIGTGALTLVSAGGNAASTGPSLSRNGRRVVFDTLATNLANNNSQPFECSATPVEGQAACYGHVILYDRETEFRLALTQGAFATSRFSQINEAGNQVAFVSRAFQYHSSNGSPAAEPGILVMDLDTGVRTFTGITSEQRPIISATGRWVAANPIGASSIRVRDMSPDASTSLFYLGGGSTLPGEFSSDETRLVFSSASDTVLIPDTNGAERDIYAIDLSSYPTALPWSRITMGGNGPSGGPVTNSDGSLIAFDSSASNFVADNNGELYDVFLLDTSPVVEQLPVANGQAVVVAAGGSVEINLTGLDPAGEALLFELVSEPAEGTLQGTPPDLTYTPAAGFSGRDGFSFQVIANGRISAPALVGIEVEPSASQTFGLTAVQRAGSRIIDLTATWPANAVWTQVREFDGASSVLWDGQAQTWSGTFEPDERAETVTFNSRYWLPGVTAAHESLDVTITLAGTGNPTASPLGGYAWLDSNGDSLRGDNEAADVGRAVTLYRCALPWGIAATGISAGADGRFDFANVVPGEYQIQTAVPADGFSEVSGDNVVYGNGFSNCFTFNGTSLDLGIGLVSGDTNPPVEPPTNVVQGFAWIDGNADGVRDLAELADANLSVTIYRCGAPWGIAGMGVTGTDGRFIVDVETPGEYQLGTQVPVGGFSPLGADNNVHPSGFTNCVVAGADTNLGIGVLD